MHAKQLTTRADIAPAAGLGAVPDDWATFPRRDRSLCAGAA
jgi:hypothetical protein